MESENENPNGSAKKKPNQKTPEQRPIFNEASAKPIHRDIVWFPTGQIVSNEELLLLIKESGIPDPERTLETIRRMTETKTVELLEHYGTSRNVRYQRRGLAGKMEGMHQFRIGSEWRLYWRINTNPKEHRQSLIVVVGSKHHFGFADSKDGGRTL